jgi:hypothetical protein
MNFTAKILVGAISEIVLSAFPSWHSVSSMRLNSLNPKVMEVYKVLQLEFSFSLLSLNSIGGFL